MQVGFPITDWEVSCFSLFMEYTKRGLPRRKLAKKHKGVAWMKVQGLTLTEELLAEPKAEQEDHERDRPCPMEAQQQGARKMCAHPR